MLNMMTAMLPRRPRPCQPPLQKVSNFWNSSCAEIRAKRIEICVRGCAGSGGKSILGGLILNLL